MTFFIHLEQTIMVCRQQGLHHLGESDHRRSAGRLEHHGVPVPAAASSWQQQQEQGGATVLALAHGQELLGLLAVRDALRPDAAEALAQLRCDGLALAVLSAGSKASR